MSKWRIQIVSRADHKTVRELTATTRRDAERIEDGISRNINHDEYMVVLLAPEPSCRRADCTLTITHNH